MERAGRRAAVAWPDQRLAGVGLRGHWRSVGRDRCKHHRGQVTRHLHAVSVFCCCHAPKHPNTHTSTHPQHDMPHNDAPQRPHVQYPHRNAGPASAFPERAMQATPHGIHSGHKATPRGAHTCSMWCKSGSGTSNPNQSRMVSFSSWRRVVAWEVGDSGGSAGLLLDSALMGGSSTAAS